MKLLKWIKYRRLQNAILDVCGKNHCATCPSSFKYSNGATGCHGAQFLFGAAAKTYDIPESETGVTKTNGDEEEN